MPEEQPAASREPDLQRLQESVRQMEQRLTRLERYLGMQATAVPVAAAQAEAQETALEMQIGEFWLARVGIIALLLGLSFLMAYPFPNLPVVVPGLVGGLAVTGLFALSRYWRGGFPHLSRLVFGGALVLLYITVMRLHFFSGQPLVGNTAVAVALVVLVLGIELVIVARRRNQFLAGLVAVECLATSVIVDVAWFGVAFAVVTAAVVVELLRRYNWQALANATVALAYLTQLVWLLNNPLMGHPLGPVAAPPAGLVWLFAQAALFAAANCCHYQSAATINARFVRTMLNALGLLVLVNATGFTFFRAHLALVELGMAVFFLGAATLYWLHRRAKYSTSLYACAGYLALSAAIVIRFPAPQCYLWLGWQSLLVAATAIWFCSKIVIVVNVFIYLGIYLVYLLLAPASGAVNLSYAVVALLSARLLNWQQRRLELRTEMLRNLYLVTACVVVPYGLYHVVPKGWVSSSWLGAAVVYFLMSLLLRNKKYRWLAIVTSFAAAVYAFTVDLARLDPLYRVVSFLAVGLVLLLVSLFYARSRKRGRSAA